LTYKNVSCYNWKGFGGYTKTQYAKLDTWEYDLVTSPTFQKDKIWGGRGGLLKSNFQVESYKDKSKRQIQKIKLY
jgi:hypothetical protein